ncbi:hypothetical protein Taro_003483 [Colocasia esculenta]|uniref:Thioesterase domain-containing protein n=1 Tax=Colocasia esculenta TaxID=4460 RepID=A0A843TH39_COLES|nr:hypothetical protein [Colocasia esculenta]
MDLQAVRDSLEKAALDILPTTTLAALPAKFYDNFIIKGIQIDHIEPGRVICSMRVPPRLLNNGNFLHGGATASLVDIIGSSAFLSAGCPTSGVSMEINISYLDAVYANEEIEIEAKVLRAGKAVGVVAVELRKKQTGKIIAQGRHTKYLAVSSKL